MTLALEYDVNHKLYFLMNYETWQGQSTIQCDIRQLPSKGSQSFALQYLRMQMCLWQQSPLALPGWSGAIPHKWMLYFHHHNKCPHPWKHQLNGMKRFPTVRSKEHCYRNRGRRSLRVRQPPEAMYSMSSAWNKPTESSAQAWQQHAWRVWWQKRAN